MIKQILQRIKVDWKEYWWHFFKQWDERRDAKRVVRAIETAKIRTSADGKKRYVMRDWRNFPDCYTRRELQLAKVHGIITLDKNFIHYEKVSIAVITQNGVKILKKKEDEQKEG